MRKVVLGLLALLIGTGLAVATPASADPISPGFDFFETDPGAFVVITPPGTTTPMTVPLRGRAIGPGTTDTIVQRHQGLDTFPGTVEIELVQLSLQSVAPVIIGGRPHNMFVDELPSPRGSMTIGHETPDGGTFTSILPVHALLTFVPVGGGDPMAFEVSDRLLGGTSWSHTPPPGHPAPGGDFFPAGIIEQGGVTFHPASPPKGGGGNGRVAEPSTLLLLGLGLAGLATAARRR